MFRRDRCVGFMYMGRVNAINLYKHGITRSYLIRALIVGEAHQNCGLNPFDRRRAVCNHLEASLVSCRCRGGSTSHDTPHDHECGVANLTFFDPGFKTQTSKRYWHASAPAALLGSSRTSMNHFR